MPTLSRGRIVLYQVHPDDPPAIRSNGAEWLPAIVVQPFSDDVANLQVFCDGVPGSSWKTSVQKGDGPGQWMWPPKV